ncbi:conserved hypothetical protein [Ricinus communis]|uniref:Uncharacterized protein n=1 Tax=Ricinus communis TaxID=3988 RepID=B9TND4_RICCO|nr:conserved hypothetical protein [Ricinus communis]
MCCRYIAEKAAQRSRAAVKAMPPSASSSTASRSDSIVAQARARSRCSTNRRSASASRPCSRRRGTTCSSSSW